MKPNHSHYQQQQQQLVNCDLYNGQMDSAMQQIPTTMHESLLPFYQSNVCDPNKADSGLTYNIPLQRKRSRDFTSELISLPVSQKNKLSTESSSFLDQVLFQFQNQQSEIDRILAHHVSNSPPFTSIFYYFFNYN